LWTGWFFGAGAQEDDAGISRSDVFAEWLETEAEHYDAGVRSIVRRTALEAASVSALAAASREAINDVSAAWTEELAQLSAQQKGATSEAFQWALDRERLLHEREYLLKYLAARAFLPGYGFPTDLVTFNTVNVADFKGKKEGVASREDNIFMLKEKPTRGLSIAIREYAPGAQTVLDGRVFRSAGVALRSYAEPHLEGAQNFSIDWRCANCGAHGYRENAYAAGSDITCDGCARPIATKDINKILRPVGFTTDFWEDATNDASSQKYIPVERPLISVNDQQVALPDPRCGFMRFGDKGRVVYKSAGEHGTGYAVCMSCGRAESMGFSGKIPKNLSPGTEHRAIGGPGADGQLKGCSAERVIPNLFLGHRTQTDVLEVALREPVSGNWIPDSADGQTISNTLAVALRDAIADRLGVSSDEMGYGTRVEKDLDTLEERRLIQVYDDVAGGAGFVLTAIEDIAGLLGDVSLRLQCPADCENVCPACLAGSDSRVEYERLDRRMTLEWLQQSCMLDFLRLPEPFQMVTGARYWPYAPMRFVRNHVSRGGTAITICLSGEAADWDLGDPDFRKHVLGWRLTEGVDVTLVVPDNIELSVELKEELAALAHYGIRVATAITLDLPTGAALLLQVSSAGGAVHTLLTDQATAGIPDAQWLRAESGELWVVSELLPALACTYVDASSWRSRGDGTHVVEILRELNGPVAELSNRFRKLLGQRAADVASILESDAVVSLTYEDRYLRSPWTVLLLVGFLRAFRSEQLGSVHIRTYAKEGERTGFKCWDDWRSMADLESAMRLWVKQSLAVEPQIMLEAYRDNVPHRRLLTVGLASGKSLKLAFDHGMGFWKAFARSRQLTDFDFTQSREGRAAQMLGLWKTAELRNAVDQWATDITVWIVDAPH
jgi:hypothetical protein